MQQILKQIDELNDEDFESVCRYINQQSRKRVRDIMSEAQRKANRLAKELGVDLGNVNNTTKTQKPLRKQKYRNPLDENVTWSGFGRQPEWFKEHIERGGSKEELEIAE